jgi:4-diphosphocytidyl-2-C-methyl-D-erythritol kinase
MRSRARVIIEARAKLNLALAVGPRRPDGDHEIATVFQSVSLADTLIAERRARGFSLEVRHRSAAARGVAPGDHDVAAGGDNLVLRAARTFALAFGLAGGARFVLLKRIPSRAGLGGGSSDAAAALRAMAVLHGLRPRRERLMAIAAALGADVPFALFGGTALGLGRGERLERLRLTEPFHAVVAVPAWRISTATAFRRIDRAKYGLTRWNAKLRSLQALRRNAITASVPMRLGNEFEDVLGDFRARYDSLSRRLIAAGLASVRMTGSGSAVFGITATRAEALRIIGRVHGREPLFLVRSTGAGHLLKSS